MAYKKYKRLEYDPVTRMQQWVYFDPQEEKIGIGTSYDWGAIIEDNKRKYAATDERAGWRGDLHRIGSIPLALWQDVMQKTGNGKDREAVRRWINDPDNRFFLTRPVKL